MDTSGIRKIDVRIDDAPARDRETANPSEKKVGAEAAETLLRELKEKNRRFNKLKKEGLVLTDDIKTIQKDLRNTIKDLKNILDNLPD